MSDGDSVAVIRDADDECVTFIDAGPEPNDAKFIVRTVNSHEDLLTALKAIVESLNDDLSTEQCKAWDAARAAIVKAEHAKSEGVTHGKR
jgi:hypothetical protein